LNLLIVGVALIVLGFVVCWLGARMKAQGLAEPPSFGSIAAEALAAMFKAIGKVLTGPTTGDRLEGAGSLSTYLGFLLIVVWAYQQLNPPAA